jgi:hypothetical protein
VKTLSNLKDIKFSHGEHLINKVAVRRLSCLIQLGNSRASGLLVSLFLFLFFLLFYKSNKYSKYSMGLKKKKNKKVGTMNLIKSEDPTGLAFGFSQEL